VGKCLWSWYEVEEVEEVLRCCVVEGQGGLSEEEEASLTEVLACRWNEEVEANWSVAAQVCLSEEELVCSSGEGEESLSEVVRVCSSEEEGENLMVGRVCHWSEAVQACSSEGE
jgi:hypothetical protein